MFPLQPGLIGVAEDERIDGWMEALGSELAFKLPFFYFHLSKHQDQLQYLVYVLLMSPENL